MLAAELTPAADRPYFGGSTDNNILQLAIGYNGLGRLDGNETGSIGGGGRGGGGFGGASGLLRLFGSEFGGQISWLLPAALIALVAMLWWSRRAARTDKTRAAALLWGGWVLVTGLVFSYMAGIIHPYYMVALAPGIGALIGIGAMAAWRARLGPRNVAGRAVAAAAVVITAVWSYLLLDRTPGWLPWLRLVVLVAGVACGVAVLAGPWLAGLARTGGWRRGRLALALVPVGLAWSPAWRDPPPTRWIRSTPRTPARSRARGRRRTRSAVLGASRDGPAVSPGAASRTATSPRLPRRAGGPVRRARRAHRAGR